MDLDAFSWKWKAVDPEHGNYGNANQWAVGTHLGALVRESAQNSLDARLETGPATVTYTVVRLDGDDRRKFEQAVKWEQQLAPHLAAMATGTEVFSNAIRQGLEELNDRSELVMLRISDTGCRGLTGPELATDTVDESDYGNFVKLCRLDLFSGKAQTSGGSYGLGKAVYWRFSAVNTVLLSAWCRQQQPGE